MNAHARSDARAFTPHESRRFLSLLHAPGDVFEIRLPKYGRFKLTGSGYFDDVDLAIAAAARWDGKANLYVTLNPVNPALLARAVNRIADRAEATTSDDNITRRRWLFIDIDAVRPSGISSTDEELGKARAVASAIDAYLVELGWPRPVVAMSGNGYYLLHRIDLPNDDDARDLVAAVLRTLAYRFDSPDAKVDPSVSNASRIVGLVGALKMKGDATAERPYRRSYVTSAQGEPGVVSRAQLEQLAVAGISRPSGGSFPRTGTSGSLADLLHAAGIERREQPPDANGVTWYHVRQCPFHDDGRPFECGVGQKLPDGPYAGHCFHPEGQDKGWQEFKRALGVGTEVQEIAAHVIRGREPRATHDPAILSAGDLPQIMITGLHLREKTAAAWRALVADNDPPRFFRHGAYVAQIVSEDGARPRISHLNVPGLRGRLDRCANWTKIGPSGVQPTSPPKEVVEDMLELPEQLPPLRGIVGIPTYARDGMLETTPGYQMTTQLYYESTGDPVPSVPERPDATDLKRAKQIIGQEWLADFPFVDDASRANAIAAPLTAVARELIDGPTPLFAIDAPAQGTGKSLLANGIGAIITGTQPAVTTETRSEEELRKRITALLRGGAPVVLLDNITKRLESGTLCSLLTAPMWSDRLLSKNETIDVPVRAVWLATGNNLELSGEMTRRVVWIRLDARIDRPWERSQFRHQQLNAWVVRHRHELVWAFLMLAQHWIAEGRPEWRGRVLGSFESWSLVVGGVLEAAGIAGFMENREQLYRRMDAETEEWRALVHAWWEEHGPKPIKAATLFPLASELAPSIFAKARDDAKEQVLKATLGRAIAARRDRRYGDLFIRSAQDDGHAKVAMWRLEPAAPEPDLAGVEDEIGRTPAEPPHENASSLDSLAGDAGGCGGDSEVVTESRAPGGARTDLEGGGILLPQPPQPPQPDSNGGPDHAGVVRGIAPRGAEPPQTYAPCRGGCGRSVPAGQKCSACAEVAVRNWKAGPCDRTR